jgi:glutathione synthase/RimK-type ligase-like ATP-grasp enzyme
MLKKVVKKILFYLYCLKLLNWKNIIRKYKSSSNNIIVLWVGAPANVKKYFLSASFENDMALLNAVVAQYDDYRISIGGRNLNKWKNKSIYINLSNLFPNVYPGSYTDSLHTFYKSHQKNEHIIIPSYDDMLFWENKLYMHQKFNELNISHPKTIIIEKNYKAPQVCPLPFPVLFKPAHASGSTGIVKLENQEQYLTKINETTNTDYLIQEWIDMKRDLRLIYIGDELVLHYWRINQTETWKPTSTGHGSKVDFCYLPEHWMDFLYQEYKKLGIHTGAFDVTWQNDDLTTRPLILEVSPSYMPNPAPSDKFLYRSYIEYKNSIKGELPYYKKYIDLVFNLKLKFLKTYE